MVAEDEANRLRALLTLMREFGATKVVTADGLIVERPPLSPLELHLAAAAPSTGAAGSEPASREPEDDDVGEEAKIAELKEAWREHWARFTASSGSHIPEFPGLERAEKFLGRWSQ